MEPRIPQAFKDKTKTIASYGLYCRPRFDKRSIRIYKTNSRKHQFFDWTLKTGSLVRFTTNAKGFGKRDIIGKFKTQEGVSKAVLNTAK